MNKIFILTKNYRAVFYYSVILFILIFACCKKTGKSDFVSKSDFLLKNEDKINAVEIKKIYGYGVANVNRLRLRSDSDLHSKTLRYIDKGDILKIIEKDEKRVRIDEMEDYWYEVEIDGIKGYVFGFYIDIYTDFENANYTSKKYLDYDFQNKKQQDQINLDDLINNNLFFLSNGKIVQILDYKKNKAKILETVDNQIVTNFYFSKEPGIIYYIAKSGKNIDLNGTLYKYNIADNSSTIVIKDIYTGNINIETNLFLFVKFQKTLKDEYWILKFLNLSDNEEKEIIKIKKNKKIENLDSDLFSNTLRREFGTLAYLEFDNEKKFIYFKPPEENQTYLISTKDSSFLNIDIERSNVFNLNDSTYIQIYSTPDSENEVVYSLVLKDKYSSFEKEIIKSKFYPVNVSVSPRGNFAAVSMVSTSSVKDDLYMQSSIYLFSLSTYTFIPVSTDGNSYQCKWSFNLIH